MTLWGLLSRIPGTPPHRTYEGTLAFMEGVKDLIERQHPEAAPLAPLPKIIRNPLVCVFAIDVMTGLLDALQGVDRGLTLDEARAILREGFAS